MVLEQQRFDFFCQLYQAALTKYVFHRWKYFVLGKKLTTDVRQEEGRRRQGEVRGSIFLSDTGLNIFNIAFEFFLMSYKCSTKVLSIVFVRHLPTSPFFKLACLTSVVSFFPRTKYFHLWNTYFVRAAWYSFQKQSNLCCSKTKCFLLYIFPCFLGLLLNFFKQKLQCLAPICMLTQCVQVGNTLKAYQRITLSFSPSRVGIFNVPHLL